MGHGRKYSTVHSASDVWSALADVGEAAGALVELQVRPSTSTPTVVIVRVLYRDLTASLEQAPSFVWQETLARVRKVDLASYLHRVVWDSYQHYDQEPWSWTKERRRATAAVQSG